MSVQNEKTLGAYQKVAKNYLSSTKLANSTYKENAKYIQELGFDVTPSRNQVKREK